LWRNYLLVVLVLGIVGLARAADLTDVLQFVVTLGAALLGLHYLGSERREDS
jgi:hypothetical protein